MILDEETGCSATSFFEYNTNLPRNDAQQKTEIENCLHLLCLLLKATNRFLAKLFDYFERKHISTS